MGEIETDVHHTHYNAFSRICQRQTDTLLHVYGIHYHARGVHLCGARRARFDAHHAVLERQSAESVQRNARDIDIAEACQRRASIVAQHPFAVIGNADKGSQRIKMFGSVRRDLTYILL